MVSGGNVSFKDVMKSTLYGISVVPLFLVAATSAFAQEAGQAAQAAPNDNTPSGTEVVVKGKRPEVSDRVDRKVYDVKNDPDAKTGMATDVLGKLPSVQVTPSGAVTLRGDSRVTVMIDGKVPSNGNQAVQSLSAADIDRIEVITNPSAAFAPEGSAGIINIITKKRLPLGISGNASFRASSYGQETLAVQGNLNYGRWTVKGVGNFNHNPLPADTVLDYTLPERFTNITQAHGAIDANRLDVSGSYKISDNKTLSLDAIGYRSDHKTDEVDLYLSNPFDYDGLTVKKERYEGTVAEATYESKSDKTGAVYTWDTSRSTTDNAYAANSVESYNTGGSAVFGQFSAFRSTLDDLNFALDRPFSNGGELIAGVDYYRWFGSKVRQYYDTGLVAGPYTNGFSHDFKGVQSLASAYVTWQQGLGAWTVLSGLRVEQLNLSVQSNGPYTARSDTAFYPSLHLSRGLSDQSKLKLSYSRRVDRPDIADYDPGIIYATSISRQRGNPNLKASNTDSFEANYISTGKTLNLDVAAFYRLTHDLRADQSTLDSDGYVVTRPVNAGQGRSSGVDLTLRGPITPALKYVVNLVLQENQIPQFAGGERQFSTYSGNSLLEYDGAAANGRKGDQYQLKLTYRGRNYNSQGYIDGNYRADLNWQKELTKNVSIVLSAIDFADTEKTVTIVDVPQLKYRMSQRTYGRYFRIGLSYQLSPR